MGYLVSCVFLLGFAAYLFHGGVVRWIAKRALAVDPMVVGLPTGFVGYLALRSVFGDREVTGFAARVVAGFYFLLGSLFLGVGGFMLWFSLVEMFPEHFAASQAKRRTGESVAAVPSLRSAIPQEKTGGFVWTPAPPPSQAEEVPTLPPISPAAAPMRSEASADLLPSLPEAGVTPVAAIVPAPRPRVKESTRSRDREVSNPKAKRGGPDPVPEALPPGVERMSKNWCPPGIERNRP